jgi:hypothetical protein
VTRATRSTIADFASLSDQDERTLIVLAFLDQTRCDDRARDSARAL